MLFGDQEDPKVFCKMMCHSNLYEAITSQAELLIKPAEVWRPSAIIEECFRQNPGPLKGKTGR
jgi:hypothetical protein